MIPISERTITMWMIFTRIAASVGSNGSEKRMKPYVPIFKRTPARMTEPAVGASVCASGSQVWNGNIGTLMANAKKNPQKSHTLSGSEKCCAAASNVGTSKVRVAPAVASPNADQEVHRDEHHFPEHVKEEEIQGNENADHAGLQQEEQNVIFLGALMNRAPRRENGDHPEKRGEHDEQEADAVDAEMVFRADRRDPIGGFLKGEATPSWFEPSEQRKRDEETKPAKEISCDARAPSRAERTAERAHPRVA